MRRAAAALATFLLPLTACPADAPEILGADTSSSGNGTSTATEGSSSSTSGAPRDTTSSSSHGLDESSSNAAVADDASSTADTTEGSDTATEIEESESTSTGSPDPEGPAWAFQGGATTPAVGGLNTVPAYDLCPFDHLLVGLKTWLAVSPESVRNGAPHGVAGLCARAFIEDGVLRLERSTTLIRHGSGTTEEMEVDVRCPEGHAVVGLGGRVGTYALSQEPESPTVEYVDVLTLTCAPVSGTVEDFQFGTPADLAPVGMVDAPDRREVTPQPCATGMVARGLYVYSGSWLDALALWCSSPRYAAEAGAACVSGPDCASGSCVDTVCQPDGCPADCTCSTYEGHAYAFCPPTGEDFDASAAHCEGSGHTLAHVEDAVENAWLASTGYTLDIEVLRLGGDDRETEGTWRWPDGTVFWSDGAIDGHFAPWYEGEPDNAGEEGEDCLEVFPDGRWSDHICNEAIPFICERALP